MNTVPCLMCGGSGWVQYHGTTEPYGDDPDAEVRCKMCGGSGSVPAAWMASWFDNGFVTKCDFCHRRRPCAIMEGDAGEPLILCAECAAKRETVVAEEAAS